MNNLRQISFAISFYAQNFEGWMPRSGEAYMPLGCDSWKLQLAPFLNVIVPPRSKLERGAFHCPSQTNASCGNSSYGDNGFYGGYGWNLDMGWRDDTPPYPSRVKISDVANPAQVLLAGDTSDAYVNTATSHYSFYLLKNLGIQSGRHGGGGNYLWVDGHVSWHSAQEIWDNREQWFSPQ
ncbi:MAG: hypothetical protein PHV34_01020 [Verrucomicrobiae bacterium]|nr:hypothetical protein [Verrucomicrobiae bacterium]